MPDWMLFFKWFFISCQVIFGVLTISLVLLHSPKSDGAALGAVSQLFSGPKGAEATLSKITFVVAIAFVISCFALGYYF